MPIEKGARQFSELTGNKKPEDIAPNSAGNSKLELARGRLEGMGYEVLMRVAEINCGREILTEVMRSVILQSLFNKFSSTVTGGGES